MMTGERVDRADNQSIALKPFTCVICPPLLSSHTNAVDAHRRNKRRLHVVEEASSQRTACATSRVTRRAAAHGDVGLRRQWCGGNANDRPVVALVVAPAPCP